MNPVIRLAERKDVSGILEIYSPFITDTAITFEESIPDEDNFWERIREIMSELPFLVCEIDGRIAGYAYASAYRSRASYRWTKEVSVYVHNKFMRRKIAQSLYHSLVKILRYQGIANLLAIITMPNERSVAFHENFGFKKCAEFSKVGYKLNQWQNVGWLELFILNENESPREKIIKLADMVDKPEFFDAIEEGQKLIVCD